jgi:hypothetical protein
VAVVPFIPAVSVAMTVVAVVPAVAVNVAKVCPAATITLKGTVTVALLLESETAVPPPAGAAPLIVTVQVADAGPVTVPGVQLRLTTCSCCGDTLNPVVTVLPFNPAVSVALTVLAVVPAVAVNVAKVCPAATSTLEGTVTVALLLDSETVVPPLGAAPVIVTVQLAVPGPVTVPGVQLRLTTCSCCCCGDTLNPVVTVLPFSPAVSVALIVLAVLPAVAVNVAEVCPAATSTLEGTVTFALLLDSATVVPPLGAAPVIVTVQLVVPGPVTVPGVQLSELTARAVGSVMVPPDPFVGIEFPVPSEVERPESERANEFVADGAICKLTEAKLPLATTVLFRPKTRQVIEPDPLEHWSDLPAAAVELPTNPLAEVTLPAG